MEDTPTLIELVDIVIHELTQDVHIECLGSQGELLTSLEEVLHLLEDPGLADRGTSDHHGIDSISVEGSASFLARSDVSVADNRDMHPRVSLHSSDEAPVSLPGVHLGTCPSVDRECLDPTVLQCLS